jgi:hypothetical protein
VRPWSPRSARVDSGPRSGPRSRAATETTSLEEVAEVSSEDYDLDVDLVRSAAELEIRVHRVGITLPFPFDLDEFWEAIDDANEEAEHIEE